MNAVRIRSRQQKQKEMGLGLVILTLVISLIMLFYFWPLFSQRALNTTDELQLYFMGNLHKESTLWKADRIYLSLDFIKDNLDPNIVLDEENKMVIITTNEDVYHLPFESSTGMVNLKPYKFTYPVVISQGKVYLDSDPLKEYYQLNIYINKEESLVSLHDLKIPLQQGKITKAGKLRVHPEFRSPWNTAVTADTTVNIMKEVNGWYWIETEEGQMGYINKNRVKLTEVKEYEIQEKVYQPWNPVGQPILLTWEYAGINTTSPQAMPKMEGLQVISPTWFQLQADGLVVNRADKSFVDWAHQEAYQVWGLFSNEFSPELTHDFLHDTSLRIKVMKQLLNYLDLYELDGINIDFENMYLKDKEAFVQFIRELAPLLHEKDRTLSVDVTFHSKSENWSMCYDRKGLAQSADYLIVMGYDEHGSTSPVAGSVSSLPWVERGVEKMLEEVPGEKLVLGIPFYTRLWKEEINAQGKITVTSKALSMDKAESWIKEHKATIVVDEQTGQRYVETKVDNAVYKMWLEDEYSLAKRIELMKKYHLAGVGAWRRGFEKDGTWPLLTKLLKKR